MKKNRISLFLSSLMVLALVSCGNSPAGSGSSTSAISGISSETSISTSEATSSSASTAGPSTSSTSESTDYLVEFVTNGGSKMDSMTYTGTPLVIKECIKYHGELLGWYENSDYSGEPINKNAYVPTKNTTLYAKWDEVLYLYLYYGVSTDHFRYSHHEGDAINLSTLYSPSPIEINKTLCPFTHWAYDGTYLEAPNELTFGTEDIFLVAQYDKSNVPPLTYLSEIEPNVYQNSAKLDYRMFDSDAYLGYYSADISMVKGKGGASGLTCRMSASKIDYAFEEDDESYIGCVISPNSGNLQFMRILDGSYASLKTVSLTSLPASWQSKFSAIEDMFDVNVNLGLICLEDSITAILDGEIAYTYNTKSKLDLFTGTSFGVRATTIETIFSNIVYRKDPIKVNLECGEGGQYGPINYYGGPISLPSPSYNNNVLDYWCYDQELTQRVDPNHPVIEEGITLYAKYRRPTWTTLTQSGDAYNTTGNTAASLIYQEHTAGTITMVGSLKKGNGGAYGIIFHASHKADNTWETDAEYIMAQVCGSGTIQVAYVQNGFSHLLSSSERALASQPQAWQDKYNAAASGDVIPVSLKVEFTATSFSFFIDGNICMTLKEAYLAKYQSFAGDGIGIRINSGCVGQSFTFNYEEAK